MKLRATDKQIIDAMRQGDKRWNEQSDEWLIAKFSLLSDKQQRVLIADYLHRILSS